MLEARKHEIFVAPAPGLVYARVHEASSFGIGRAEAERMGAVSGLELMAQVYPKMRKRGIRILPGGDYGFPYNPVGRNTPTSSCSWTTLDLHLRRRWWRQLATAAR